VDVLACRVGDDPRRRAQVLRPPYPPTAPACDDAVRGEPRRGWRPGGVKVLGGRIPASARCRHPRSELVWLPLEATSDKIPRVLSAYREAHTLNNPHRSRQTGAQGEMKFLLGAPRCTTGPLLAFALLVGLVRSTAAVRDKGNPEVTELTNLGCR